MNFIDFIFLSQSVVTVFLFVLFFSMLRVGTILMLPCIFFTVMLTVSFVYTLYKVHIFLQHFVLILHKIFYHRK